MYLFDEECLLSCDLPNFADPDINVCHDKCGKGLFLYRRGGKGVCIDVCPYPFFGFLKTMECIEKCPAGSYYDHNMRICGVCPE